MRKPTIIVAGLGLATRIRELLGRERGAVGTMERPVTPVVPEMRRFDRGGVARCDASKVITERVAFWSALAEDQDRPVRLRLAQGPLPVGVSAHDLAVCVDFLLENVFSHTPDGTAFTVELAARARGGACLVVSDEGPGITRPDVLDRGASGGASTGLGLDIARRTAERSGGLLRAGAAASGGAEIVVEFGPPLS
ncbi:hypothetical protein GCM10017673_31170 [Streptosporangium violaceochromogenes]|nr:hypothetical protein GCM10017673_31170 [Streptosporangium violaceochromogenes]